MATQDLPARSGPIDLIKQKWIIITIAVLLMIPGLVYLGLNMADPALRSPIRLGIDFTGGTLLEYGFHKPVSQQDLPAIRETFEKAGYPGPVVQIQDPRAGINQEATTVGAPAEKAPATATTEAKPAGEPAQESAPKTAVAAPADAPEGVSTIVSVRSKHLDEEHAASIIQSLEQRFGGITLLQKNSIGPSLASELLTNGMIALLLAYLLIVGYLTYRFEFDYAVCAVLSLVHDAIFVLGFFAILGYFFHTEVDSLFITAILTVIGFSVHDTIVVFDRIRENYRIYFTKKMPFTDIVNISLNQTLRRSINTSLSTMLPVLALYLFGGETTRDFVLAIFVGILVGTYSSIFVASLLLVLWRSRQAKAATA